VNEVFRSWREHDCQYKGPDALCALILSETLVLYKSFTYLLSYFTSIVILEK